MVMAGVALAAGVGVGVFTRGNVQFARKIAPTSKKIVNTTGVRFTCDLGRL
jgi:hypothetical protein